MARNVENLLSDAEEMTLLLEQKETVTEPIKPEKLRMTKGSIEFRDVSFGYGDQSQAELLFNGLSLHINAGESVGLVGASGGGKTTITKLLLRFMDVHKGAITIDGQNVASIRQGDLHNTIAYVPQEPILFHRSVFENIAYGQAGSTKRHVYAAARKAHAHDFIKTLPQGYDTLVGERGIKLSGGQRQRIAIARAMLKQAPILLLDEATSALDSTSEQAIQAALKRVMRGRTSIVIAHRLSTLQAMDRIIVIDEGNMIEQGTHQELLNNKGAYARLWQHQSLGFLTAQ